MQVKVTKADVSRQGLDWVYKGTPIPQGVSELVIEQGIRVLRIPGDLVAGQDLRCTGPAAIAIEGALVVNGTCKVDGNLTAGRLAVFGEMSCEGEVLVSGGAVVSGSMTARGVKCGGQLTVGGALSTRIGCRAGSLRAFSVHAGWGVTTAGDLQAEHVSVGTSIKVGGEAHLKSLLPGSGEVRVPGWPRKEPGSASELELA